MAIRRARAACDHPPIPLKGRDEHYQALDGIRGLAILLVFLAHIYGTVHYFRATAMGGILALAAVGWTGVDLFFVLSGFLITGILIRAVNGPRYFRNFYIRRALRILPVFYGVFLLLAILTPFLHLEWHRGHIAYLVYCQNIAMSFFPGLTVVNPAIYLTHFWSLAVEEQYYMLWPGAIWLLRDERKVMKLCLFLIAFGILLRIALIWLLPSRLALDLVYRGLPTHWDGLLLGSWLALAMRRWSIEQLRRPVQWLLGIGVFVFIGAGLYARSLAFYTPAMEIFGLPALPLVFAGLLFNCFIPGSWELRFFGLRFLRFLGRYSYGIYVYHVLFFPIMVQGLHWLQAHVPSRAAADLIYLLLWCLTSVTVAFLSYRYFELPFLNMKERFAPSS
jgi:peptidoglycan/LPS O-acetylase OafA/YrhL